MDLVKLATHQTPMDKQGLLIQVHRITQALNQVGVAGACLVCLGFCHGFYHLTLSAQYAAEPLPFAIFFACLALKLARFFFILSDSPSLGLPAVSAPCSPNLIIFSPPGTSSPHARTTCDFVG
jgi:hypothetical protein